VRSLSDSAASARVFLFIRIIAILRALAPALTRYRIEVRFRQTHNLAIGKLCPYLSDSTI
jgi:hypothetical protein